LIKMTKISEIILKFSFTPVDPSSAGEGAQLINGQWYMPRWGCDTLASIFEIIDSAAFPGDYHPDRYVDIIRTAAAILGRKGGSVRSEKKAAAARENGKKGGRPRKRR